MGKGMPAGNSASISASVPEDDICVDKWELTLISAFSALPGAWKEAMPMKRKLVFTREAHQGLGPGGTKHLWRRA